MLIIHKISVAGVSYVSWNPMVNTVFEYSFYEWDVEIIICSAYNNNTIYIY